MSKFEVATLRGVAQHAGVSASTASRYLRGQLRVSPETAARIDRAVAETGYRSTAPTPQKRETARIGMVVPGLSNPFFASLVDTLTEAAAARGVTLVVSVSGLSGEREAAVSGTFLDSEHIDGLIYLGMNKSNNALAEAVRVGFPVVILDEEIDLAVSVDTVTVDNYGGAHQAVSYLIQQGHTRIAHVAGPEGLSTTRERLRGYVDALDAAGLEADPALVRHGPYSEQFGASVFSHLGRPGSDYTAVFAGSDIVAVGMLGTAELHGIRIPEDLSIIGCDGIRVGQWLRPKLTTLEQPIAALARASLDVLMSRIEAAGAGPGLGFGARPGSGPVLGAGPGAGPGSGPAAGPGLGAGPGAGPGAPSHTVLPLHLVMRGSVTPRATEAAAAGHHESDPYR